MRQQILSTESTAPSKTVGSRTAQLMTSLYESGQTTFTHADVEGITVGSAQLRSHSPVEIAQRAPAVVEERLGRHAQRGGRSTIHLARANPEDLAAADVVVGT